MHFKLPMMLQECQNGKLEEETTHYDDPLDNNNHHLLLIDDPSRGFFPIPRTDEEQNGDKERSNTFWKNLIGTETFQKKIKDLKQINIQGLMLDDWDPLLQAMKQNGARINGLSFSNCYLSELGAQILGTILKTSSSIPVFPSCQNNSNQNNQIATTKTTTKLTEANHDVGSFCIEKFDLSYSKGSMAWLDGFLDNRTIINLEINYAPVLCSTTYFIQTSPQLKTVKFYGSTGEEESIEREISSKINTNISRDECSVTHDLEKLEMILSYKENKKLPLNLCQGIGYILRRATKLKELDLRDHGSGVEYDFSKDAIHCRGFYLENFDFDPAALALLVQGNDNRGGKLKELKLNLKEEMSNSRRLLELVDLSLLDRLDIYHLPSTDILLRQLSENRGPKHLDVSFHADLNDYVPALVSSLTGNEKIEQIAIHAREMGQDLKLQQRLVEIMGTLPRLHSWTINIWTWQNEFNFALSTGGESSLPIRQWQGWIGHQVQSNWNIQEIVPPFQLDESIKTMLTQNKQWQRLFRHQNELSSGIWSLALSRIDTVGFMFRVLREVPGLFQQIADASSASQKQESIELPSFAVPHHPNCLGCRKKKRKINIS